MYSYGIEFELYRKAKSHILPPFIFNGSVTHHHFDGSCDIEYAVGPFNSLEFIPAFVKFAKDLGLYSGHNCGMHIHLGGKLIYANRHKIPAMIKPVGPKYSLSRRNWCSGFFTRDKYSMIYLHNQGTVEFRSPNMVLNSRYICKMVKDCEKLFEKIVANPKDFSA